MGADKAVRAGGEGKRGPRSDGRLSIDALLWIARLGAQWKDLPERFGPFERATKRYYRGDRDGRAEQVLEAVAAEPDPEWVTNSTLWMIDVLQ